MKISAKKCTIEKYWDTQAIDSLVPDTQVTKFIEVVEGLMEDYYYKFTDLELNEAASRISSDLVKASEEVYLRQVSAKIDALIKEHGLIKLHDTRVSFRDPGIDGLKVEAYIAEQDAVKDLTEISWWEFRHVLSCWNASYWMQGLTAAVAIAEKEAKKKDAKNKKRIQQMFKQPVALPESDK